MNLNINNINIKFHRIVRYNITISNTQIFKKNDVILSTFNDDINKIKLFSNGVPCEDKIKIIIPVTKKYFKIYIDNTPISETYYLVNLIDVSDDLKSITVYIKYNMADTFDILAIKNGNTHITFNVLTKYCNESNIILDDTIEKSFLIKDDDVSRYENVINFIEEYYFNTDVLNKIISNEKKNITPLINININDVGINDIDNITNMSLLNSPIRELLEFYKFCKAYLFDDSEYDINSCDNLKEDIKINIKKKNYVLSLLNNREYVIVINNAINEIKKILEKYKYY